MSFQISREYWFSAAHRLEGHPKCGRLHGHNYKIVVYLETDVLSSQGWIMDFGDLDQFVKPIVEELDHRYIVSESNKAADDPYWRMALLREECVQIDVKQSTAEQLAKYLWGEITQVFSFLNVDFQANIFVDVWETPKSMASYGGKRAFQEQSSSEMGVRNTPEVGTPMGETYAQHEAVAAARIQATR